ncbi:MAG: rubrerythrin family protein [Tissierellia bacterium]|nr:rubrerythrin family protein [Tissierellia bacterium]
MHAMTQDNLRSAYGGESQAHMRYRIWGDVAEKEGFPTVKRLFIATSDAEQVHATLHFKALKDEKGDFAVTSGGGFGIGNTSENLQGAINGELHEVNEMYPAFIAVAELQGEKTAIQAMRHAIEAEKVHAERFAEAKAAVDAGKDLEVAGIYLCPVCGYIGFDPEEEKCPLCNALRAKFIEY